ncbi:MAG: alpha/beta fold hydrolase [Thermoleophilia bacterium]
MPGRLKRGLLLAGLALAAVAAVAAAVVLVVLSRADPPEPDSFYDAPSSLPEGPPGRVIRSEELDDPPDGARAWRILYLSRGLDGAPAALSGLLFVPDGPAPEGGREVVAHTHGTVGVARGCAVSRIGADYWPAVDGLDAMLGRGAAVVVPDYQGLGTAGPHPYLVGEAEATATLDAVRAAHAFGDADAGTRFVVWGASQGGHAALFTGQLAASYAPELTLLGVAAAAPATDLVRLFVANRGTMLGRLLSAYTLASWSEVYPSLRLDQVVAASARPVVRRIATICVGIRDADLVAQGVLTTLLRIRYLRAVPWETEPWRGLLRANTPGSAPIPAPVMVTQGDDDPLVRPPITAAFVERLCAAGQAVVYRTYPGVRHLDAGPATAADVAEWVGDRFAGRPAPTTCR